MPRNQYYLPMCDASDTLSLVVTRVERGMAARRNRIVREYGFHSHIFCAFTTQNLATLSNSLKMANSMARMRSKHVAMYGAYLTSMNTAVYTTVTTVIVRSEAVSNLHYTVYGR
ncbi:hypothetical protein EDD85DRAFT_937589 [Armillaria nabsnona]|nr:hypothetical protein EDD85DRAFT_937589 [Armillaria nabsnona]